MRGEWGTIPLGEICSKVITGGTPSSKIEDYYLGGTIPWLKTKEVNYNNIYATETHITQSGLENSAAKMIPRNSIIMAMYGQGDTAGRVAINKVELATNQACCNLVIDPDKADYRYVYYQLKLNYRKLVSLKSGSAQPNLNTQIVREYNMPVPPLRVQRAIAATLSCLDDKIELNNKISANLEAQAQTIFKSWFVDFEPFQGGEFVDSEFGPIPKDWRVGTFCDLIDKVIAGDWGKETAIGNNTKEVYCIRGADIPAIAEGNKGKMPLRFILPKNFEKKQIKNGDLVVEISGGSPTQSTGRIVEITDALLQRYDRDMVCTNFCKAVSIKSNYSRFVYRYWKYLYNQNVMFGYENGTTGIKNFAFSDFTEMHPIIIPPEEVVVMFNKTTNVFSEMVYQNGIQSETLAILRDTLLPKLMSGEIEVPTTEAAIS